MAITIPPDNKKAFEDVMDALGGDDYSYYLFDVKNVEDKDSTKKVQVALKVYVGKNERLKAVENIRNALLKTYEEIPTNKKGTSLDVPIPDKSPQVIRIEVKPESSKGSGGGSAATAIQEAAQCCYTAMRYYCGDVKHFTTDDFKCGWKYTDAPKVKLEEIMSLPQEWKESSWEGAKEIFKKVGAGKYVFVRGDAMVEKAISAAFNRFKGDTNLASEDKWNPADIWMVKASRRRKIVQKLNAERTIDCLNNYLQQARKDGELIGISLKKIEGKPKMTLMNGQDPKVMAENDKAHFAKYDLTFDNGRKKDSHPMDVYLYYGTGTFQKFQARNFGGPTKGDWKLELKGKSAAQGKMQGKVVSTLLKDAKFGQFNDWGSEQHWSKAKNGKLDDDIYDLLVKYNAKGLKRDKKGKEEDKKWIAEEAEQAWKYSKWSGLKLLDWIHSHKDKNQIMKELYLYASSQSNKSSVYWKLQ